MTYGADCVSKLSHLSEASCLHESLEPGDLVFAPAKSSNMIHLLPVELAMKYNKACVQSDVTETYRKICDRDGFQGDIS